MEDHKATVDNVCIRVQINGKWESVSLREAVEAEQGAKAVEHMVFWLMGLRYGDEVKVEHIEKGLELINMKREQDEVAFKTW